MTRDDTERLSWRGGAIQSTLRRTKLVAKHAPAARVQRFVRRRLTAVQVSAQTDSAGNQQNQEPTRDYRRQGYNPKNDRDDRREKNCFGQSSRPISGAVAT